MYESFYKLSANPFRLVPDARFFYPSSSHRRGLAYLRYGIEQGQGFVVVTGRPGTGKSTLVQALFSELLSESLVVANLASTNLGADDILRAVGNSFGVHGDGKRKASLLIAIEDFLKTKTRQGKRVVLIVDEAHNLPKVSLEELRMLSNFQEGDRSLLQIMLLGQQQLLDMLSRPDMEQLSQRVIASCHLHPLNAEETRAYISHRLQCTGWHGDPAILTEALGTIYSASHGIPRMINVFCDRLLLSAAVDEQHTIDLALTRSVLAELETEAAGRFDVVDPSTKDLVALLPLLGDDIASTAVIVKEGLTKRQENSAGKNDITASVFQDDTNESKLNSGGVSKEFSAINNAVDADEPSPVVQMLSIKEEPLPTEWSTLDNDVIDAGSGSGKALSEKVGDSVQADIYEEELLQRFPELQDIQVNRSWKKVVKGLLSLIGIVALVGFLFTDDIKKLVNIGRDLIHEKTDLFSVGDKINDGVPELAPVSGNPPAVPSIDVSGKPQVEMESDQEMKEVEIR